MLLDCPLYKRNIAILSTQCIKPKNYLYWFQGGAVRSQSRSVRGRTFSQLAAIVGQLINYWLIDLGCTPYRQYSSHVTAEDDNAPCSKVAGARRKPKSCSHSPVVFILVLSIGSNQTKITRNGIILTTEISNYHWNKMFLNKAI